MYLSQSFQINSKCCRDESFGVCCHWVLNGQVTTLIFWFTLKNNVHKYNYPSIIICMRIFKVQVNWPLPKRFQSSLESDRQWQDFKSRVELITMHGRHVLWAEWPWSSVGDSRWTNPMNNRTAPSSGCEGGGAWPPKLSLALAWLVLLQRTLAQVMPGPCVFLVLLLPRPLLWSVYVYVSPVQQRD